MSERWPWWILAVAAHLMPALAAWTLMTPGGSLSLLLLPLLGLPLAVASLAGILRGLSPSRAGAIVACWFVPAVVLPPYSLVRALNASYLSGPRPDHGVVRSGLVTMALSPVAALAILALVVWASRKLETQGLTHERAVQGTQARRVVGICEDGCVVTAHDGVQVSPGPGADALDPLAGGAHGAGLSGAAVAPAVLLDDHVGPPGLGL